MHMMTYDLFMYVTVMSKITDCNDELNDTVIGIFQFCELTVFVS